MKYLSDRVRRGLTLTQGIISIPGLSLLLANSIMNLVQYGNDETALYVSSIVMIVMASVGLISNFATYTFFKKKEPVDSIQSGYDYYLNGLVIAICVFGFFLMTKAENDTYFVDHNFDRNFTYVLIVAPSIYFVVYGLVRKLKIQQFRTIAYALLIFVFICYMIAQNSILNIVGYSVIIAQILLAIISFIFHPLSVDKTSNKTDENTNN